MSRLVWLQQLHQQAGTVAELLCLVGITRTHWSLSVVLVAELVWEMETDADGPVLPLQVKKFEHEQLEKNLSIYIRILYGLQQVK